MDVVVGPSPDEIRPEEGPEHGGDVPGEEEKPGPSSGRNLSEGWEALAKAISSTLGAVIRDFDSKAESAARSQDELSLSLDRLTAELDNLLEDAPLPFLMQHAAKISAVRKRVSALNFLLNSIQRRIDNIDRLISTGSSHGMEMKTSSPPP